MSTRTVQAPEPLEHPPWSLKTASSSEKPGLLGESVVSGLEQETRPLSLVVDKARARGLQGSSAWHPTHEGPVGYGSDWGPEGAPRGTQGEDLTSSGDPGTGCKLRKVLSISNSC